MSAGTLPGLVVYAEQLCYRRLVSAHGTRMVAFYRDNLEAIVFSVHEQQSSGQPVTVAENILEHVLCDNGADGAGNAAKDTTGSLSASHGR